MNKYTGKKTKEMVGDFELTVRQAQVCRMVHMGMTNKGVGNRLSIAEKTVKFHLTRIFKKMRLRDRKQLMRYMCRHEPGESE